MLIYSGAPSLSYCHTKGLVLLGVLAVLVPGIIVLHVFTRRKHQCDWEEMSWGEVEGLPFRPFPKSLAVGVSLRQN